MTVLNALQSALGVASPYISAFLCSLVIGLVLVPVCRRLFTYLGMVDKPGPRRINKTPIPRAGGLAIYLSSVITSVAYILITGNEIIPGVTNSEVLRFNAIAGVLVLIGLADDRFSLSPKIKLLGQIAVALAVHYICGAGFHNALPMIPAWLDAVITVFWIVGAINAFNLIDGLDGLASGLALIACVGMAGALLFSGRPGAMIAHCILAGGCLAFLRYNFHPASIFLGDTGSMFLGFSLATLSLMTGSRESLFLSIGVPILAMGVPIFDTSLAIIRRTIRAALKRQEKGSAVGNGKLMTADADHLHHRILRQVVNQRTAAWTLYLMAIGLVGVGILGLALKNRAAGLYIIAFLVGAYVVVKDMERIELWDVGRLLRNAAYRKDLRTFRRRRMLRVPVSVVMDVLVLSISWMVAVSLAGFSLDLPTIRRIFPIFTVPVFLCLVAFRVYMIVWSRATVSDFFRLMMASLLGTAIGTAAIFFMNIAVLRLESLAIIYFALASLGLIWWRALRGIVRDIFYFLGRLQLEGRSDVERILVYGAGLRFRSYRRELVRATGNTRRLIVGILDDDILLKGHRIGNIRVFGTLRDAPAIIQDHKIETVVITCLMSEARRRHIAEVCREAGAKVLLWNCEEREILEDTP